MSGFKPQITLLPLEDIILDVPYALTINLSALTQSDFISDYKLYRQCLDKLYSGVLGLTLQFYPEYSPKGRLHLHGIIKFTSVLGVARFYQSLPQLLLKANIKLDVINDLEEWMKYITKQKHIMYPYCKHNGLKYLILAGAPIKE